ncbi:MAG: alpha-1,2-fucosyltransferase [Bacilli bacterium]|nr:alpha-1,2-fucosyltransferase [Bacilli bacterium]
MNLKIVRIKGGDSLGNQMFEYAFIRMLEMNYNQSVYADFSALEKDISDTKISQNIDCFNLIIKKATKENLKKACLFPHNQKFGTLLYKAFLWFEIKLNRNYFFEKNRAYIVPDTLSRFSYLDGYWQSWRYLVGIEKEMRAELSPKKAPSLSFERMKTMINSGPSAFVGFRKGDYTAKKALKKFGIITESFYLRAMSYIQSKIPDVTFYVFSNDIEWVKNNVNLSNFHVVYIDRELGLSTIDEQQLMACCQNAVIPNSTFHWWGAWLIQNPNKIVIAPEKWFVDGSPIDILPPEWIQMPR